MPVKIIPKGTQYGRLTTTGNYKVENHYAIFECLCKCGNYKWIKGKDLNYGSYKSCGCYQKEVAGKLRKIHGLSGTRIYIIYHSMLDRCNRESDKRYKKYGAKGISVCDEWQGENGFLNFYLWSIKNGYSDNLTIDRIDGNGNYEPQNCRWADYFVQSNNTSRNHFVTYMDETHTIGEWARIIGINYNTLNQRIWSGIPIEIAMTNKKFKKGEIKNLLKQQIEVVE